MTNLSQPQGLFKFMTDQMVRIKCTYLATLVSWSLVYGLPLWIGALSAILIEKLTDTNQTNDLWILLTGITLLMLLRSAVLYYALQKTFQLIFKTASKLKLDTVFRFLDQKYVLENNPNIGNILNSLRDDTEEIGGLSEWTTDLIYRIILTIIAITVLVHTDLILTLPLLVLLAGLLVSAKLKQKITLAKITVREKQGEISEETLDIIKGIRDLRLLGATQNRINSLEKTFEKRRSAQVKQQFYTDLLSDLFRNLVLVGTFCVLLTMSFQIKSGQFDAGKLVLFITYSGWLGQQMYFFGKILARYQNAKVAFSRLQKIGEVVTNPNIEQLKSYEPLKTLSIKNLGYTSSGIDKTPKSISLDIKPGECIVITGNVGSGKSRWIESIVDHHKRAKGEIFWNEQDVSNQTDFFTQPRIAYLSQYHRFFSGSLKENIILGSPVEDTQIIKALSLAELNPHSKELPMGLDTLLTSGDANELSGGQKKRLALARMLVKKSQVIIIDDFESSLDSETAIKIWNNLKNLPSIAIIAVSQNPDIIASANRVIEMSPSKN